MAIQLTVMSLDFESSSGPVTKVFKKTQIYLGRDNDNDMVLSRPEVSKRHALLRVEKNGAEHPTMYLTDLGSSNGTMVESRNLEPELEVEILPNQRIIIGNYLIKTVFLADEDEDSREQSVYDLDSEEAEDEGREMDDGAVFEKETAKVERPSAAAVDLLKAADNSVLGRDESAPTREMGRTTETDDEVRFIDLEPYSAVTHESVHVIADAEEEKTTTEAPTESTPLVQSAPANSANAGAAVVKVAVLGNNVLDLNFEATKLFLVSGSIMHKSEPLSGVCVSLGGRSLLTDAQGAFSFDDIPEGEPLLFGVKSEEYQISIPPLPGAVVLDNVLINCTALKFFTLSGKVERQGEGIPGVRVHDAALGERITDEFGKFSFERVLEDSPYHLTAEKDRFSFDAKTASGVLSGSLEVTITGRQYFTLSGRVTHKGAALAGVVIDAGVLGQTTTGPDGAYSFENALEGEEYVISAAKDGFLLKG